MSILSLYVIIRIKCWI